MFSSTINGAHNLTLTGGTAGNISFGAVGGITPLTTLTATGATIAQNSTVVTTGAVSYTGGITLGGNIITTGGAVSLTGPTSISAATTIDTTNTGAAAAGANVTFSSTLNGAETLYIVGGTGGTVAFDGAVGATTPLTSLTVSSAAVVTQGSSAKTTGILAIRVRRSILAVTSPRAVASSR